MSFENIKAHESTDITKEKIENKNNPEDNKEFIKDLNELSENKNDIHTKLTDNYTKNLIFFWDNPNTTKEFIEEYNKTKEQIDKPLDTIKLPKRFKKFISKLEN